jgi:hypothetical protein
VVTPGRPSRRVKATPYCWLAQRRAMTSRGARKGDRRGEERGKERGKGTSPYYPDGRADWVVRRSRPVRARPQAGSVRTRFRFFSVRSRPRASRGGPARSVRRLASPRGQSKGVGRAKGSGTDFDFRFPTRFRFPTPFGSPFGRPNPINDLHRRTRPGCASPGPLHPGSSASL